MVKPVFRRKSIGTKVSEEEYARLEAMAGGSGGSSPLSGTNYSSFISIAR